MKINALVKKFFEFQSDCDNPTAENNAEKAMREIVLYPSLKKKTILRLLETISVYSPSWKVLVLFLPQRKDFSRKELLGILHKYSKEGFDGSQIRGSFLGTLCLRKDFSTKELLTIYMGLGGCDPQIPFAKRLVERKDIPLEMAKKIFESHRDYTPLRKLWGAVLARLCTTT